VVQEEAKENQEVEVVVDSDKGVKVGINKVVVEE